MQEQSRTVLHVSWQRTPQAAPGMNFVPSEHQAAGHAGCMTAGAVFAKLTSRQEIDFYACTPASDAPLGDHLSHWMPTFMGTLREGQMGAGDVATLEQREGGDVRGELSDGGGEKVLNRGKGKENDKENDRDTENDRDKENGTDKENDKKGEVESGMESGLLSGMEHHQLHAPKSYLVLLNLYYGLRHPCILDIKLGAVLVDESVSEEKRLRLLQVSRSTTSGSLGFRICGMKIYSQSRVPALFPGIDSTVSCSGNYMSFDKHFGRSLTPGTVGEAIHYFFSPLGLLQQPVMNRFLQRLSLLYNCLLDTEVRIKSGSLCFVYDADMHAVVGDADTYYEADALVHDYCPEDSDDDDDDDGATLRLSSLHLIDFAHAKYTPGQGPDDNLLNGIESLIAVFSKLLNP